MMSKPQHSLSNPVVVWLVLHLTGCSVYVPNMPYVPQVNENEKYEMGGSIGFTPPFTDLSLYGAWRPDNKSVVVYALVDMALSDGYKLVDMTANNTLHWGGELGADYKFGTNNSATGVLFGAGFGYTGGEFVTATDTGYPINVNSNTVYPFDVNYMRLFLMPHIGLGNKDKKDKFIIGIKLNYLQMLNGYDNYLTIAENGEVFVNHPAYERWLLEPGFIFKMLEAGKFRGILGAGISILVPGDLGYGFVLKPFVLLGFAFNLPFKEQTQ